MNHLLRDQAPFIYHLFLIALRTEMRYFIFLHGNKILVILPIIFTVFKVVPVRVKIMKINNNNLQRDVSIYMLFTAAVQIAF